MSWLLLDQKAKKKGERPLFFFFSQEITIGRLSPLLSSLFPILRPRLSWLWYLGHTGGPASTGNSFSGHGKYASSLGESARVPLGFPPSDESPISQFQFLCVRLSTFDFPRHRAGPRREPKAKENLGRSAVRRRGQAFPQRGRVR